MRRARALPILTSETVYGFPVPVGAHYSGVMKVRIGVFGHLITLSLESAKKKKNHNMSEGWQRSTRSRGTSPESIAGKRLYEPIDTSPDNG